MRSILKAGLCVIVLAASGSRAAAQNDSLEEVVVTAERRLEEFDAHRTPYVTLSKRADNLITEVTVVCDTRDESQRRAELKATLRNLVRAAAQDKSIELGLGEEVVGKFDETMLESVIVPGGKTDTSRATLLVKTAVTAQDTFDSATSRIRAFVERAPKVGRTEALLDDEWQLTLVGPAQYRAAVMQLVAQDAAKAAALFGPDYGVEVSGLQLPVSWYRAGPLDLALYIPYTLTIRNARK